MANFQVLPMFNVQDLQVYKEIEDLHSIVPFHRQMLAAILVIVTILGASIFASGQEEISTETIPISRRLLDWKSLWSNSDENSNDVEEPLIENWNENFEVDGQLMEYAFFFLFGYCCSEVVNHLMLMQPKVFRHNFV